MYWHMKNQTVSELLWRTVGVVRTYRQLNWTIELNIPITGSRDWMIYCIVSAMLPNLSCFIQFTRTRRNNSNPTLHQEITTSALHELVSNQSIRASRPWFHYFLSYAYYKVYQWVYWVSHSLVSGLHNRLLIGDLRYLNFQRAYSEKMRASNHLLMSI
jgi:hypothetical protein